MAEIVKTYLQDVPAFRFIGIRYTDEDRVDGTFAACWEHWFEHDYLVLLEQAITTIPGYEDSGTYLGMMRWSDSEPFEYWIGMFAPAGAAVPDGYSYVDFPAGKLGVCWVKGQTPEVFLLEESCIAELETQGHTAWRDSQQAMWVMERYGHTRFNQADADGDIILDICVYLDE